MQTMHESTVSTKEVDRMLARTADLYTKLDGLHEDAAILALNYYSDLYRKKTEQERDIDDIKAVLQEALGCFAPWMKANYPEVIRGPAPESKPHKPMLTTVPQQRALQAPQQ